MSQPALMAATVDVLRKAQNLSPGECDCTVEGMPPDTAPKVFYGVFEGPWKVNPIDYALDESLGVNVAISVRSAYLQRDRLGRVTFLNSSKSIYRLARRLIGSVHNSYGLLTIANGYIDDGGAGFGPEPLLFAGSSNIIPKSGDWWASEPDREAGLAMVVSFFGARRIQYLQDVEQSP